MTDFLVQVRIKNARIIRAMRARGMKTLSELAKASGLTNSVVGEIVSLKKRPYLQTGEWSWPAMSISSALHVEPEDLWPQHIAAIKARRGECEFEASMEDIMALKGVEGEVDRIAVQKALTLLSPRQARIVSERFGLDGQGEATLRDVAEEEHVGHERIRQIEFQALRTMKHPSRRKYLED